MSKKKTLTIKDYQQEFLEETGINASEILRSAIDHIMKGLTEEEKQVLKEYQNIQPDDFSDLEIRE